MEFLLGQIAFVFRLQVEPPLDGILELLIAMFQDFDRFGIGKPDEVVVDNVPQGVENRRIDPLVEERHIVGALRQHVILDGRARDAVL